VKARLQNEIIWFVYRRKWTCISRAIVLIELQGLPAGFQTPGDFGLIEFVGTVRLNHARSRSWPLENTEGGGTIPGDNSP
jgi:hypothetical protein